MNAALFIVAVFIVFKGMLNSQRSQKTNRISSLRMFFFSLDNQLFCLDVNSAEDISSLVTAAIRAAEQATDSASEATRITSKAAIATNIAVASAQTTIAITALAYGALDAANNATVLARNTWNLVFRLFFRKKRFNHLS